jgi:hypothetical protein
LGRVSRQVGGGKMWFGKKKKSKIPETMDQMPRFHHYFLAHYAFRMIAQNNPLMFFSVLASPGQKEFIKEVILSMEEQNQNNEKIDFSEDDLTVDCTRINNFPAVLIEFPKPLQMGEVYFIAAIMKKEAGTDFQEDDLPDVDYFTLEYGLSLDGSKRTVFCNWTKEGTHGNYGDGPPPEKESFLLRVTETYRETGEKGQAG